MSGERVNVGGLLLLLALVFGLGWWLGGQGGEPAVVERRGSVLDIGDMMKVCQVLRDYASTPAGLEGCDAASNAAIDDWASQAG